MKKRVFILFFFIAQIQCLFSQPHEFMVPFNIDGKWGLITKDKKIVVPAIYDEMYFPHEGLSRYKLNGKYGFVGINGVKSIKAKYDQAEDFHNGTSKVTKEGYTFHIKVNGRIGKPKKENIIYGMCGTHKTCVYPKITDRITIIRKNNKLGIAYKKAIRQENQTLIYVLDTIPPIFDSIVPITHQLMYFVKNGLISFAHEGSFHGEPEYIISRLNFEFEAIKLFDCSNCSHGKNKIIGFKKNGLWGYKSIQVIATDRIPSKYYAISSLAKGLALIEYEKGKFGYLDQQGNEYFIW